MPAALDDPWPSALVVDVQRFSLHDGPGIRTTVFFKGCPLRCAWCHNPDALRREPEIAFHAERCRTTWCCAAVCPEGAIVSDAGQRIDPARCTACGRCAGACDHGALRVVGTRMDVDTLEAALLKDRDFFVESGGGVTLSGGEPMLQAAFLRRLLPRLAVHGVHVAMETAGLFRWADMVPLLPHLGLVYFDLKHLDRAAHRRLTGAGNRRILSNFTRLAQSGVRLEARMPVVPGLNDGDDNVRATARFLRAHGHTTLHCLAYHDFGEAKLPRLAPILAPLALRSLDRQGLEAVAARFRGEGIDVVLCD